MSKQYVLAFASVCICAVSSAQTPNEGHVSSSEAAQHELKHSDPLYPPIAKAVRLQGTVHLRLHVDKTGKVTKVEVIGGPPMLTGAAVDAAKQWSYTPFEIEGKPAAVMLEASVPFSLGIPAATERSDQAIGQAYFPLADQCRSAMSSHDWPRSVKLCAEAAETADRFPDPASRTNERRVAHQDYGQAFMFARDPQYALDQFHLVVAIANKSLTPPDEEYASAYYFQAFAEHALRMTTEAERDYQIAEASYRAAIKHLPEMTKMYNHYLAHTLAYHSVLADQTGHADQADAMRTEALQLDPHSLDGMGKPKQ